MPQVPHQIEVRFEHITRDSKGKPGKVHCTINGTLLCDWWTRAAFQGHKSGVTRVGIEQFMERPCGRREDGSVVKDSCLGILLHV